MRKGEIQEKSDNEDASGVKQLDLEPGTTLWLEDGHWQSGFQIQQRLGGIERSVYVATSWDETCKSFAVHIGPYPSFVERFQGSWEDTSAWFQVHRQTKVLNILKHRGVSSRFLPQIVASGRLVHPPPCRKQSPKGRCDHAWCGVPVLVTTPVGEPVDLVVAREGVFASEEALRCCHDCLSALRSAGAAEIMHSDISPAHVLRAVGADGDLYYVLVDWGQAVLGGSDTPAVSLKFSSTVALKQGKLLPASDAESLVYLLFFICGGSCPEFDSVEAALSWRQRAWSTRAIQQRLGDVSAVLKAFADYVGSICGTPYPVDYDIWLKRLLNYGGSRRRHERHSTPSPDSERPAESSGSLDSWSKPGRYR